MLHCRDLGWREHANGTLVNAANQQFDAMITVDKNMRFQTSLVGLRLRVLVVDVRFSRLHEIVPLVPQILERLETQAEGSYAVLNGG